MNEVLANIFENLLVQVCALQLEHVLHQVVSIRVLNQIAHLLDDLPGKLDFLGGTALLQTPLDHAAAVLLLADFHAVEDAGLENELRVLLVLFAALGVGVRRLFRGPERSQKRLDDVVSVRVHGQLNYSLL